MNGDDKEDKRSLQSIKALYKPKFKRSADGVDRNKRQADYYYDNDEFPSPTLQNAYDYDDIMQDLNTPTYESPDKRFLGKSFNLAFLYTYYIYRNYFVINLSNLELHNNYIICLLERQ